MKSVDHRKWFGLAIRFVALTGIALHFFYKSPVMGLIGYGALLAVSISDLIVLYRKKHQLKGQECTSEGTQPGNAKNDLTDEGRAVFEVYEKMRSNPDLVGSFEYADGQIIWRLFDGYTVEIASMYISINKLWHGHAIESIYHWHPDDEELYSELCKLGTRGNVTVIRTALLGSCPVYTGPRTECPFKRKWFFGKYVYLYAE